MKGVIILSLCIAVLVLSAGTAYGLQSPVVQRDVVYCDDHGVPLMMDLYHPRAREFPTPVVVYIHGGGWYSGDKTQGAGMADIPELVSRGYLVASINYRLAPKYKFPAQIEDVRCAVRYLRENASRYHLDSDRIGVFGDSAGGQLSALLGLAGEECFADSACSCSSQSAAVQAVVDMFGPADLTLTFEEHWSMLIEHVFNVDEPASPIIRQASPVNYVSGQAPPFLIIQGAQDDVVLPEQSDLLYAKLQAAGAPATLLTVKNAGHEFVPVGGDISPSRSLITAQIADFFDRYLK